MKNKNQEYKRIDISYFLTMGQGIKILLDLEKIIQHSSFYERYDWLEICYQKPFFGPVNCSKRVDFQTFSEQIYENRTSLNKNT